MIAPSPGHQLTARRTSPVTGWRQISSPVCASSATNALPIGRYMIPSITIGTAPPSSPAPPSGRIRKVYEKLGLVTIGDLLSKTEKDLLKSKNLGVTSIKEIRKKLAQIGVAMRPE